MCSPYYQTGKSSKGKINDLFQILNSTMGKNIWCGVSRQKRVINVEACDSEMSEWYMQKRTVGLAEFAWLLPVIIQLFWIEFYIENDFILMSIKCIFLEIWSFSPRKSIGKFDITEKQ